MFGAPAFRRGGSGRADRGGFVQAGVLQPQFAHGVSVAVTFVQAAGDVGVYASSFGTVQAPPTLRVAAAFTELAHTM